MDAEAPSAKKKGKGKGKFKFILIGVAVLLLLGGGGAGFAMFKGLGPFARKNPVTPPAEKPKAVAKAAPPPSSSPAPTTTVRTLPPTTTVDPEEGAGKLAKLWNEVETPQLLAIAKDWREPDLARVAIKMDAGKVAEMLSAMPPKRASALSREMQRLASIVSASD